MKCERIQDLILTDFSDGQLSQRRARRVETHLMHCLTCRILAQKVREDTDGPFKNVRSTGPDEFVWLRIKEKIQAEKAMEDLGVSPADIFGNFVYSFRSVAVAAGLLLMIGVGMFMYYNPSSPQTYLTYMMGAGDAPNGDDVTVGIERYFL